MRKAFVFDFDDTLATTTARIKVMDGAGLVTHVQPRDFSNFKLNAGEYFDFTEFRDDRFIKDADPTFLMYLAQEVSEEDQDVYILTAREDDSADAIQSFLASYNVNAKTIHCVGGTQKNIPQKKREMLLTIMAKYDKIYYYDDSSDNIEGAPEGDNIRKYQV
jgi:hypothetical protein